MFILESTFFFLLYVALHLRWFELNSKRFVRPCSGLCAPAFYKKLLLPFAGVALLYVLLMQSCICEEHPRVRTRIIISSLSQSNVWCMCAMRIKLRHYYIQHKKWPSLYYINNCIYIHHLVLINVLCARFFYLFAYVDDDAAGYEQELNLRSEKNDMKKKNILNETIGGNVH